MISPITTQSSSDLSRTPPSVKVKEEFNETYMSPNANLKMLFSVISPELKKTFSRKVDDENSNHNKTLNEFESNNTKENYYIRSSKSLNVLCQKFLALFNEYPTETVVLQLDQVALQLKVERRRIYDIINIMESLEMATKIGKNQYQWHGKSNLKTFLQKLKDYGDLLKAACKETVNDTTKASDLPLSLGVKQSKFEKMNKSLSQEKCATTNNHENINVFSIENKPFRSCLKQFSNAQNTTSEDDGNNQIWNDIQQSYSNNNSFTNVNFNVNSPSQICSPYPYFNAYGFPTFRQSLGILSQKFLIHLLSAQDKMVFMEDMAKIIDGPEQFSTTFLQRENKTFSNFSAFNAKTHAANYFYSPVDNNQQSIQNNFLNGEHMKCFTNFAHSNSSNMSFSIVNDLNNKSNNESNTSTEKKTKNRVRRLYDIANVLSSLALVEKVRIKSAQGYNRAGFAYIGPTLQERLTGKYGAKTQKIINKTDSEGLTLPENSVQPTETLGNGHQNLFLKNVLHTVGPHRHSLFKPPQVFEQKSCSYLKSCPSKLASHSSHSFSCILPRNNADALNGPNLGGNANANNSIIVPNPQFGVYKTPIYPKYNEETNLSINNFNNNSNPSLLNGPNIIYTKPPSILTHQTLTKNTNAAPLSSNGKKFIRVNSYAFAKSTIHNTCLSDSKVVSDTQKSTLVMMNNPGNQRLICTTEGKNKIISPLVMCQLGTTKQKTPFVKNFTTACEMETKCDERSSKLTRENSFTLMYLESLLNSQMNNHFNNSNLVETIDNGITNSKNINSEGGNLFKTNSLSYLGYPSVSNILPKQEPINLMEKSNLNTLNQPGIEDKENRLSQKRKLSFPSPQRINTLPLQNITNKDITIQKQNNSSFLGILPKNNFMEKTNMSAAKKLIYNGNKNTMEKSRILESNKENIY